MLAEGFAKRGHRVEVWSPQAKMFRLPAPGGLKKWLGYVDQYLLFPWWVKSKLRHCPPETLFVFADQALGPWVPLVADRPHVIHCHDFLAQRSALGEIPLNPTMWSDRRYQAYIRNGYRKGRNFISISEATRQDLHRLMGETPPVSEVVYNGLNGTFAPLADAAARPPLPYLLHVGGNQWYKNRVGVVEVYGQRAKGMGPRVGDGRRETGDGVEAGVQPAPGTRSPIPECPPLVLVGPEPNAALRAAIARVAPPGRVEVLCGIPFPVLRALYNRASLFFFPSLAEGFGWPIAEAQACGCPVITTGEAPMSEVAGEAAEFLPPMPAAPEARARWRHSAVAKIDEVLAWSEAERAKRVEEGVENARRFDPAKTLDAYEQAYKKAEKLKM